MNYIHQMNFDRPVAGPRRSELACIIEQFALVDGQHKTAIPSLSLYRFSSTTEIEYGVSKAALVMAAQGTKRVVVAGHAYDCGDMRCLITSVDLPMMSQILDASTDKPYLGLSLSLNVRRIADLISDMRLSSPDVLPAGAISATVISEELQNATLRLVRLLKTPLDIPILAPLIEREVLYRLMLSEQGARLRHLAVSDSQSRRITEAIEWIKNNFTERLRIEELSQRVNMSVSSLHHHFKDVTAMSPLQYQKQLRLHEARRLLVRQGGDVNKIAAQVGYESASQFTREYSRLFGLPPLRDVSQLRGENRRVKEN
jgi:AraC-like DNA-binding protein